MVKKSNIGFLLGILVVVGLGMYLFRSGLFSQKAAITPSPTPAASPLAQLTEEPIMLLDEEPAAAETTDVATIHEPVDTALGDNPLYLLVLLFGSAGVTFAISKKLEARI
ncbi:hypothetical protein A3B57_00575 [Microgenomates group bacterium RIFCSPLOWO2_01_FULL_47_10]|nr:MAG: hypothetical protein A3B57_00575 [Microgenomates group bacterium RIFCSPLOWO2_01_FULL_47_10]